MTTNIQLLRSSVLNKRPNAATLLDGQAAVNLNVAAPGLFFKTSDGSLSKIGPVEVTTTGNAPNSSPAGSSGNALGETWLDARSAFSSPVLKVYNGTSFISGNGFTVNDTTGDFGFTKTITTRTAVVNGTGQYSYVQIPQGPTTDQASITAAAGMVRFDTTTSKFKGYNGTEWIDIGQSTDGIFENLTVTGDTILGDSCVDDTLTVTAVSTFNCNVTFAGTSAVTMNGAVTISEDTNLLNRKDLRFYVGTDTSSSNYVGLEAPAAVGTSYVLTLPTSDGANGELLRTDGNGNLSWSTPAAFSFNQSLIPTQDNLYDIGSPTLRVRNIYTGDLHLRNDRGDWTMIEEVDYLSLRNNSTGKVYKIAMEEVS